MYTQRASYPEYFKRVRLVYGDPVAVVRFFGGLAICRC